MNLEDDLLKISGEEVSLQRSRPADKIQTCFRAILEETVDLPPHAESIIPVRAEGLSHIGEKWGILEPVVETSYAADGLMIGRTLVNLREPSVPVRVMNLGDNPRRIKKGSVIAMGDTVQSILGLQSCHNGRIQDVNVRYQSTCRSCTSEVYLGSTLVNSSKSAICFANSLIYFLRDNMISGKQM